MGQPSNHSARTDTLPKTYVSRIAAAFLSKAKENGLVRIEGKDYIVKDGDVILFRFNV